MAADSLLALCPCLHVCAAYATSACMRIQFIMLDTPQCARQAVWCSKRPIAKLAFSVAPNEHGSIAFWGVSSCTGAHCCQCNRVLGCYVLLRLVLSVAFHCRAWIM